MEFKRGIEANEAMGIGIYSYDRLEASWIAFIGSLRKYNPVLSMHITNKALTINFFNSNQDEKDDILDKISDFEHIFELESWSIKEIPGWKSRNGDLFPRQMDLTMEYKIKPIIFETIYNLSLKNY